MGNLFDKVTGDQDIVKKLGSYIHGFKGYIERQNRRAADKLLRESVADRFEELWKRTSALQADLISQGGIAYIDDMEKAAIQLRTFVDKIRTATYGYSGFFDAVKINEDELAQLYAFDNAFFDAAEEIGRALDNLENTLNDETGLPAAIRNLITLARQATETFNRRYEVLTSSEEK
ncbi:MAG: hypothetical protein ABIJ65_05760 [Chloroflexota bacterium]